VAFFSFFLHHGLFGIVAAFWLSVATLFVLHLILLAVPPYRRTFEQVLREQRHASE
jgi:hypothetical protein